MKSIQLYSLPSRNETSGLNRLCPSLTKSTANCGCLMMPCGNETAASWEDLMITFKSQNFSILQYLLLLLIYCLLNFLMNSSGCIFTTWCSPVNHVLEQCSHAMDNHFPIMKNISLNTTHFGFYFILDRSVQMQFLKWPHSVRKSETQKSALAFCFSTFGFLFWLHMHFEWFVIHHQNMLCWQKKKKKAMLINILHRTNYYIY